MAIIWELLHDAPKLEHLDLRLFKDQIFQAFDDDTVLPGSIRTLQVDVSDIHFHSKMVPSILMLDERAPHLAEIRFDGEYKEVRSLAGDFDLNECHVFASKIAAVTATPKDFPDIPINVVELIVEAGMPGEPARWLELSRLESVGVLQLDGVGTNNLLQLSELFPKLKRINLSCPVFNLAPEDFERAAICDLVFTLALTWGTAGI